MTEAAPSRLMVESIAGIYVVRFTDRSILSEEEVRQVVDQLSGLLDGRGAAALLLNFAGVTTMSSHLLAELVGLQRSLVAAGGVLKLCCLAAGVRPLFSWCQVGFAIHAEEQGALDSF